MSRVIMAQKLSVKGLGLALGVTWAIGTLILGLSAWLFDYGTVFVELLGMMYVGYTATFAGSIIGAIYAFVDAFIGGALIAWFYNLFTK